VIENLAADFELTMGMAGCHTIAEIDADALALALPAVEFQGRK
jgi:isopentenyl diphosphate isomerase/L-lactate dehydrogenase-like FMN-dependent dehydrogenase